MDQQEHPDWTLIAELGGPAKVAARIGVSVQRVQNWKTRGIPAAVKLQHRFLLRDDKPAKPKSLQRRIVRTHPAVSI